MNRYIFQDTDPVYNQHGTEDAKNCGAYSLAYYSWLTNVSAPNDWTQVHNWYQQIQFGQNEWGFDEHYASPFKIKETLEHAFEKNATLFLNEQASADPTLQTVVTNFTAVLQDTDHSTVDLLPQMTANQYAFLICYNPANIEQLHYMLLKKLDAAHFLLLDPNTGEELTLNAAPARGTPMGANGWYYSGAGILVT